MNMLHRFVLTLLAAILVVTAIDPASAPKACHSVRRIMRTGSCPNRA